MNIESDPQIDVVFMDNFKKYQLWRVDLVHVNGYKAPYKLVEIVVVPNQNNYKIAHSRVMGMSLRLLDFPEKWSFRLIKTDKKKINGKWI